MPLPLPSPHKALNCFLRCWHNFSLIRDGKWVDGRSKHPYTMAHFFLYVLLSYLQIWSSRGYKRCQQSALTIPKALPICTWGLLYVKLPLLGCNVQPPVLIYFLKCFFERQNSWSPDGIRNKGPHIRQGTDGPNRPLTIYKAEPTYTDVTNTQVSLIRKRM